MVWRLIIHHEHEYRNDALNWYRNYHLMALGWGHVSDLNSRRPNNEIYMKNLYWDTYGNTGSESNYQNFKRSLCQRFYYQISIGDEVILVTKRRVCVVRVTGDYFFDESYPDDVDAQALEGYCHRRRAEYVGDANYADHLWKTHDLEPGTDIFNALIRLLPRNQVARRTD